jgi:NADP-dependent 3-hydroxy acid dehydrogenase YdfG
MSTPTVHRLEGRVAAITASAAGIGAATARRLASEGASLVLSDIDVEALGALGDEIGRDRVVTLTADAGQASDLERQIDTAVQTHGRLDILVNNAVSASSRSATSTR